MKWLRDMKIKRKLLIGFILVAIITGIVGVIGITSVSTMAENNNIMYEKMTVGIADVAKFDKAFANISIYLRDAIRAETSSEIQKNISIVQQAQLNVQQDIKLLAETTLTSEGQNLLDRIEAAQAKNDTYINSIIRLIEVNNDAEAEKLLYGEMATSMEEEQAAVDELMELKETLAHEASLDNTASARISSVMMIAFAVAGVVIAILMWLFLASIICKPIDKMVIAADKLAVGDLSVVMDISTNDEVGVLSKSIGKILQSIKELVAEASNLTNAAVEGRLQTRGDTSKYQGAYSDIVQGVNDTLDAVIGPLYVAADYVDRISKGDIPEKITNNYNGDFNTIKNNLNVCIDAVNNLVKDANMLSVAAIEGRLATRADATKHYGDFRKIVQGVNDTLDAVINPLNVAADYVDKISRGDIPEKITDNYNGDFNTIKNNLNVCIDAVNELVADANMLSVAAVEGRLSTRADVTKHYGDFRRIVQGVNETLDAVMGPINDAIAILAEMAKGNMNVSVDADYKGDHALIKNALNKTIDTLNDVLNEINTASEQVAAGSSQVSDSSQALSQGSTEQASSIEELTSSIHEITDKTKRNANNADQASELALNAQNNAVQGNKQMQEMLKAMDEINESSVNISKIIKVIDEIAFQTNILALNAAVEAARAGQHGKGFAVVAEEVRNLAARSANAAKETTTLIEGSIKKSEAGTKIAQDTAEALGKIVDGISKAAELVGEIAVASNEQAIGISQVNQGIEQVSDVVQNNSATAEESASASQELSSQADILKDMVAKFTLKTQGQQINSMNRLNPEIARALEEMSEKGKSIQTKSKKKVLKADPSNIHIKLNDTEFGKY
jgi:methyl-accepting chemotaxis protein